MLDDPMPPPLLPIAEDLAAALGDGWTAGPGPHSHRDARLTGPDGEDLRLVHGTRRTDAIKVFIRSCIPDELLRHAELTTTVPFQVKMNKPTHKIVEGMGFWLDRYRSQLSAARHVKAEHDADIAARDALVSELAATLGTHGALVNDWSNGRGDDESRRVDVRPWVSRLTGFQVRPGHGNVHVNLVVPVRHAVRLAEAIAAILDAE